MPDLTITGTPLHTAVYAVRDGTGNHVDQPIFERLKHRVEHRLRASTARRGLRRQFDPGVLEQSALIALGRAAGLLA